MYSRNGTGQMNAFEFDHGESNFSCGLTGCVEVNKIKHNKNATDKKQMCSPFL